MMATISHADARSDSALTPWAHSDEVGMNREFCTPPQRIGGDGGGGDSASFTPAVRQVPETARPAPDMAIGSGVQARPADRWQAWPVFRAIRHRARLTLPGGNKLSEMKSGGARIGEGLAWVSTAGLGWRRS